MQLLCHQILVKVCRLSPGVVLGSIDALMPPLETVANKTVKDPQVRQSLSCPVTALMSCTQIRTGKSMYAHGQSSR